MCSVEVRLLLFYVYYYFTSKILVLINPRSRVLDQTDVSQHFARTTFGIRHSYHADDMVTRFSNSLRREGTFFTSSLLVYY